MYAKLATAKTILFGPILDTDGDEYTGAAVGDLKICKNNGTPAALNGSATLTHKEVGMYELVLTTSDISAVGVATIQLSKTTYVAAPVHLDVLPAKIYDSLVGGTDNLEVDLLQILGHLLTQTGTQLADGFEHFFDVGTPTGTVDSLPAAAPGATGGLAVRGGAIPDAAADAAGGLPVSDAGGLDMDAILSSVKKIASGTAAISTTALAADGGFVITTGTNENNDEDSTHQLNGTTHDLEPNGGTTDCYYIFDVGGSGVPVTVTWQGYVNAQGDTYTVHAYNFGTSGWEQVDSIDGASGSTVFPKVFDLTNAHVGTGANLGLVHLRFYSTDGTKLATDRIFCSYSVVSESSGYQNGAIWVKAAGTSGTEFLVNGTAGNPCPWADALVIGSANGMSRFHIINGETITLTAGLTNSTLEGNEWTLALGAQAISGCHFEDARVSGVSSGTGNHFCRCEIDTGSYAECTFELCGFDGGSTITLLSAATYRMVDCYTKGPAPAPIFDFGAAVANTTAMFAYWAGGLEIANFGANGTDKINLHGSGRLTIAATSTAGTIGMHGFWNITDNVVGGFVAGGGTINDDARYTVDQINAECDSALSDWGKTGFSLLSTGMNSVELPADIITAASIKTGAFSADAFAADALVAATFAASSLDGKGDWSTVVPDAAGVVATALGNLETHGDSTWATATGFSTHTAANVVTELGTGSTLTACITAVGFSTHDAAAVVTAFGTGDWLTACLTATGFSTHDAAAVVTALGTGSTLTACLTATGFNTTAPDNVNIGVAATQATNAAADAATIKGDYARRTGDYNTAVPDVAGTASTLIGNLHDFDPVNDTVTTDSDSRTASKADVGEIKAKTDGLNFTGSDVKATLDGEEVTTDSDSRTASKADTSGLATEAKQDTAKTAIDGIKTQTDKLADTLEDDDGTYRFTENALEEAPTGGGAETVNVEIEADEITIE